MMYLMVVLCDGQYDRYTRQLAGLMLKNRLKKAYGTMTPQCKQYIKQCIPSVIGDGHVPVRRTAGVVVTTIVEKEEGFEQWPGLLEGLVSALQANTATVRDGALYCVELLCEDATRELEDHPKKPLNGLIPCLIAMMKRETGVLRLRALKSVNRFVTDFPNALKVNMDNFLEAVFGCANDKDAEVIRQVCKTFNTLCDLKPDFVGPYINSIANFMMAQTASKELEVRGEACEFWQVLSEQVFWHEVLRGRVRSLLPLLLDGMMYGKEEVEDLMELDDAMKPLKDKVG